MIVARRLDHDGNVTTIPLTDVRETLERQLVNEDNTIWIDLVSPTEVEEKEVLEDLFAFHSLAIRDCRREHLMADGRDHLPKVEDYGRYLFCIVNPLVQRADDPDSAWIEVETRQLNAFLGEAFIVTHHYEPLPSVATAVRACEKNPSSFRRGPDFIYHLILDGVVDGYTPILDYFDQRVDDIEARIFSQMPAGSLQEILALKRQIFVFRRITVHQRELVHRLARGEFELVTEHEIAYYRNVYDHLVRAADLSESYRDMLTALVDAHLSTQSNRLNEIMKVLAVISTFFLPLTFIVGLYGMNFHYMPELGWRFGYAMALAVMAVTALGMWTYFRRRGWL